MVASLEGIRFDQIYTDNSGGPEFDSDLDGTATQEDEFISVTNSGTGPMDISGWQLWSDSTGSGAPDQAQDGLYHTFPPGTVLSPGQTLYVINEITGPPPGWAQEASEGGVESGAGGISTNLLTEGSTDTDSESVALVNPLTGQYIVFNMSPQASDIPSQSGFPGTTNVGTDDGSAVQSDPGAGFSYRYNSATDDFGYTPTGVPCFVAGTLIHAEKGLLPIETLVPGDRVLSWDNGPQTVSWVGLRQLNSVEMNLHSQHPIEFKPGSLGEGRPARTLRVSPQHRMLLGNDTLAPARGLTNLPGVRVVRGARHVNYHHLLVKEHNVIFSENALTETLLPGPAFLSRCRMSDRLSISKIVEGTPEPARPCLTVREAADICSKRFQHTH